MPSVGLIFQSGNLDSFILVCVNISNLLFCSNKFSQCKMLTSELDGIVKCQILLENVKPEAIPLIIFVSFAKEQIKI